ncbi:hypothetical protein DL98DRAFT_237574 [Cadophora sp. DSE1049]|nr:hypothetical protein DL98DRAFT_237574 [Cadophora sp. DSE1049]
MTTGCIGLVYRWIDLVLIHNPEKEFWRVEEVDEIEAKDLKDHVIRGYAPEGSWAKIKWFTDLWLSARGVGWNIRASQMPAAVPKETPRSRWIRDNIIRIILMYLGTDITTTILMNIERDRLFFDQSIWWQVCFAWTAAFRSYYMIEVPYYIAAIPAVGFGISSPQDWPPITGSFRREAYTIRKMWGTCWHQLMRRPCSEGGRIVKQIFGLQKGSFASRYSQIWIAFLISTSTHHAGAVVGMFDDGGFCQMLYFMMQPVGIMLEDLVIHLGKKRGWEGSVWAKRLGFLWVIVWFSWSLRFMVAYQPSSWFESYLSPSLSGYLMKTSVAGSK